MGRRHCSHRGTWPQQKAVLMRGGQGEGMGEMPPPLSFQPLPVPRIDQIHQEARRQGACDAVHAGLCAEV